MNGYELGQLERRSGGVLRLQYAQSWLAQDGAVPLSLRLPLSDSPYDGVRVESWFQNLLPDHRAARERLATALGAASDSTFDLLTAAGPDCIGAVQLLPIGEVPNVRVIDAQPLNEPEVAEILRRARSGALAPAAQGNDLRISLAGAQDKTALLWHTGRWQRPRGATPTSHILKLPIGHLPNGLDLRNSVEIEWLCLRLMSAYGQITARVQMELFEDQRVLIVERFDRAYSTDGSWIRRLHQEDLLQAHGRLSRQKYESDGGPGLLDCLNLLRASHQSESDRENFFAVQVLYHWLAASDGHAKNFSIRIHPGGEFQLTPLYDVLSLWPAIAARQAHRKEVKMAMAFIGKNRHTHLDRIRPDHYLETARRADIPARRCVALLENLVIRTSAAIEATRAVLPVDFPESISEPIFNGIQEISRRTATWLAATARSSPPT
jgi:serine/threonine-protein kinase HipA